MRTRLLLVLPLLVGSNACSCGGGGDGNPDGSRADGGRVDMDGAPPGWDGGGPIVVRDGGVIIEEDGGVTYVCYPTECDGHLLECGDCEDNDGDGRVDSRDRECLGPCDNSEDPILLARVGGETGGPCRADCYFDFGNGPGNDDCMWDSRCDPLSIAPDFHPEGPGCAFDEGRVGSRDCPDPQSAMCLEVCRPLTPNGCDCFGCCTFDEIADRAPEDGGPYVWIGSVEDGTNEGTCTFADVGDTSLCRPCTPQGSCFNDCGRCEICVGRDEIPDDCFDRPDGGYPDGGYPDGGVPDYRCEFGEQPCGLDGDAPCPLDYYCVTGCCQPTIF